MKEPKQITTFQCIAIVINSTIGISVLALPRVASEKVGSGAIVVTCIAMIIVMASVFLIAKLTKKYPRVSIIEYGEKLISKPLGKFLGFSLILYFLILTGLVIREFGEVMNTTLLQETPMTATILSMLILVAVATRNNHTTIAYMHTFYLMFIVIPILLMVIFALKDIDLRYLKPLLGNDTSFIDFLSGGLSVVGLPFIHIGMFIILVIAPYMVEPNKIMKGSMWGIGIAAIILLLVTGVTMAVFGQEELKKSLWPMLVLTRMTELPVEMLERLDILFLVVWIVSAFTTILSGYLIVIELSSKLFNLSNHRVLSYLVIPLVYAIALFPNNILQTYELVNAFGTWGITLTVGYPLLLLLISLARKEGGKRL